MDGLPNDKLLHLSHQKPSILDWTNMQRVHNANALNACDKHLCAIDLNILSTTPRSINKSGCMLQICTNMPRMT